MTWNRPEAQKRLSELTVVSEGLGSDTFNSVMLGRALLSEPAFLPWKMGLIKLPLRLRAVFLLKESVVLLCAWRLRRMTRICTDAGTFWNLLCWSKFLPSDFFQMDEYMNISCLFALAAFAQNQQLNIHLHHQNRPLSSAWEFSGAGI